MSSLNLEAVNNELKKLPEWKMKDGKWIERRYKFKEFMDGIYFVNSIANIAENKDHHPFISIQYKIITITLTSWNERGLTPLDFKSAAEYDKVYNKSV